MGLRRDGNEKCRREHLASVREAPTMTTISTSEKALAANWAARFLVQLLYPAP
jgi:hypothetical protein